MYVFFVTIGMYVPYRVGDRRLFVFGGGKVDASRRGEK